MEVVKIVCPTHKRAGKVLTDSAVNGLVLCVAESQAAEYREHHPDLELVTHPDDVIGLPEKRNWVIQHFGDVFMLDDDVPRLRNLQAAPKENAVFTKDEATEIVQRSAWMAREMGAYLFGFSHLATPVMSHPMKPFVLTGYIPGHAMGILKGSKLYWHPEAKTVCDYWISGLNAYYHRKILKDLRYHFDQKDTFAGLGGLSDYRTMQVEREGNEMLRKHFGNAIVKKEDTAIAKRKHTEQRTLILPF